MTTDTVKLIRREEVAVGTLAFTLEKPPDFQFTAGQFAVLTLIDPPETDAEGNRRIFSIASAPHEDGLLFAVRLRDTAFKRVLQSLPLGTAVSLKGPLGSFTLPADATAPVVFLIGGIGITPVRSLVVHAAHAKLPHSLFLFYSNRRPEDAAFLTELQALESQNPNYHLIATVTEAATSAQPWRGETGYIDRAMLERHLPDLQASMYYLAGPAAMVGAMRQLLESVGASDDRVRSEKFTGY